MEYISVPLSETALNEHAKNGWRLVPGSVVDRAPLDAEKPEWCAIMERESLSDYERTLVAAILDGHEVSA